MPPAPLAGKSLVLIGGSTGLGLSAARALVGAGARVLIVGRDQTALESALIGLGEAACGYAGDATDPATAPQAIEIAVREFGRLDGLYHVAGGSGRRIGDGPLDELTDEGWRATLDLNLTSV